MIICSHRNAQQAISSPARLAWLSAHCTLLVFLSRRVSHDGFILADEQASPEQIRAWRAMTGAQRLRLAERLYWSARKLKAAGLRHQHPEWPDARINEEVRLIFSHART